MSQPSGRNALFPTLTPEEYRGALAGTLSICTRLKRAGMVKTSELPLIKRAEQAVVGNSLQEKPFEWFEGRITGGGCL
jgi:hypothetical protein